MPGGLIVIGRPKLISVAGLPQVCDAEFHRLTNRKHVCKSCSHAVCDAHATKAVMRVPQKVTVCGPCGEYIDRVQKVVNPNVSLKASQAP
jgi:hypothetical protein